MKWLPGSFRKLGYVTQPATGGKACSETLEWAAGVHSMAMLAKANGDAEQMREYQRLSTNYRNLWDGEYKVRLQFYHSHIAVDPPGEDLPYTVRVRVHENTPNEVNYTHTGVAPFEPFHHPTDLPAYWEPLCALPGWTDACTFKPVKP